MRLIDLFIRRTTYVFYVIQLGLVYGKVSKIFFLKYLSAFLKGLQFKQRLCFFIFGILKLFRKLTVHFPMVVELIRKLKLNCSCDFSLLFLKVLLMQLLSCLELLQLVCELVMYFIEGIHLCLQFLLQLNPSSFTYLNLSFELVYLGKLLQAYLFIRVSNAFKLYSLLLHLFLSLA